LHIPRALKLSNPEVGSSRRRTEGSVISSTPIDALFLSPPDNVLCFAEPIGVFEALASPNSFINASTLSSYSLCGTASFSLAAKVKASLGVKCSNSTSSYMT
jgi:hypothetical protein